MVDHERNERIPLPAGEARCEPQRECTEKAVCARYQAAIPKGTPLGDYSLAPLGGTVLCPGLKRIADLPKPQPAKPTVKPWPTVKS